MKFETVLYAVSFFLLALISLPENKEDAKKPDAAQAESAKALTVAAEENAETAPAEATVQEPQIEPENEQEPPRSR